VRRVTALALLQLLLMASPALAQRQNMDDLGSEAQTSGYGRIFAYVCGVVGGGVVLIGALIVFKGFLAESSRGKRMTPMLEDILDKKKPREVEEQLYLGEKVPDWKIANRVKATTAALQFLSRKDNWFELKYLVKVADEAFRIVKGAIEVRSVKKAKPRVAASCLAQLQSEIDELRNEGELHLFGILEITGVDVVHVEAPAKLEKHTFTALISLRSRNFYQSDKTGELLRGDRKSYVYQEFLRFSRSKERWLVERVRPAGDMDFVLTEKNLMTKADLDKFAKKVDPELLREFESR
jgi:hypothetical protein